MRQKKLIVHNSRWLAIKLSNKHARLTKEGRRTADEDAKSQQQKEVENHLTVSQIGLCFDLVAHFRETRGPVAITVPREVHHEQKLKEHKEPYRKAK